MLHDGILKYAIKRIHFKARQMLGRNGFTEDDFDDLRQELMLDVLRRLPKFNGNRAGIKVFICHVIDHRIASLIKHQEAGCRDHRRAERSLDDWVHDKGGTWTPFGKTVTEDETLGRLGRDGRSRQEQVELALDTATVLSRLDEGDRELCLELQVKRPLEISREKGVRRAGIYERIKAIRNKFLSTCHAAPDRSALAAVVSEGGTPVSARYRGDWPTLQKGHP
jgi:RNA polymerase sigma-70 factor (ECF subfamily)